MPPRYTGLPGDRGQEPRIEPRRGRSGVEGQTMVSPFQVPWIAPPAGRPLPGASSCPVPCQHQRPPTKPPSDVDARFDARKHQNAHPAAGGEQQAFDHA